MTKAVMLVTWLIVVLSVTACSEFGMPPSGVPELDGSNQQGYLGHYSNGVEFIQWANSNGSLTGQRQLL